ncbi:restriction endonuclease subunit S [Lactobacillus johnsonii]|uniref:Restriction endonuclease subunit S n=1 Tax=Lactobacillus johnsonii TaxID=33959 RepID=A0A9W3Z143_LACJH|nr:restriction endonuclease subunit S [Lactobacillus johnsonii]AZZ67669.1 restriction endonuclease subunit S [Lactobacillus johnsonii]
MSSTLDEICKFYSGTGFPNKFQGKRNGKYPFVKVGDISRTVKKGNITLTKSQNYINDDVVNKINGKIVPKDTIIFAKIGEALKLNRRVITNKECLIDNNILGIKPKTNKIDLKYLFYFMNHLKLEKFSESTTVPSVRQTRLKSITINIPSIDEQLEIVNILENINKAVLLKREQLSKLEILIKARFVEMFGDIIHNSKKLPTKSLHQICNTVSGGTPSRKHLEYYGGNIPFVTTVALGPNYIDAEDAQDYLTEEGVKESATRKIPVNSILFGNRVGVGKSSINKVEVCINQDIIALTDIDFEKNNLLFLKMVLEEYKEYFEVQKRGATIKGIPSKIVKNISIPIVSLSLQNEFANFVQQVDKSKVAVQKSLDETQKLYDSLMQEYFG